MLVFMLIIAVIVFFLVFGIVQLVRIPKEDVEKRKPYKAIIAITLVLLGIIVVGVICLSFLLILAVAHM